ncbi:MAG: helix-turn-helix domain-containing protein [Fusobacteriaceae bacterium]|jgi:repressor LexA|nr:helix-turn-helix domain-containing protein [Fusobacteriaceae bacterium]
MNMTGKRIKYLREKMGLTCEELGKELGVQKSVVAKWERGEVENLKRKTIEKLSLFFGVSPAYILNIPDDNKEIYNLKKIPLIGSINCGESLLAYKDPESFVWIEKEKDIDFALKVKDASMINTGIDIGDIIFIRSQQAVSNGEIAIVMLDNEATLRRFYLKEREIILSAENPAYAPLTFAGRKIKDIKIIGKAVYILKKL